MPRVTRRLSVDPGLTWQNASRVLLAPGCRLALASWTNGLIECWDVERNECFWTYQAEGSGFSLGDSAFEIVEHGRAMIICILGELEDSRL